MSRQLLCVLTIAAFMVGGPLQGGGKKGDDVLKKIQGTWQFVSQKMDGKPVPKEQVDKLTITFKGNKWAVHAGDKVIQAGTHKFDSSKKTGQVDAVVTEGEGKGSKMLGIYELKGNTMKVCFDPQGKTRPTSFAGKEGEFSAVAQRVKKKSK